MFSLLRSPIYSSKPSRARTITSTLLLLLHPLLSSLLLLCHSLLLISHPLTTSHLSPTTGHPAVARVAEVVAVARMLRWLWQDTTSALWEVSAYTLLRYIEGYNPATTHSPHDSTPVLMVMTPVPRSVLPASLLLPLDGAASPALQLLLVSLARDRLTQVPPYCTLPNFNITYRSKLHHRWLTSCG